MAIEMTTLKDAVKALNALELGEAVKFIGVSRKDLVLAFCAAVEALTEEQAAGLPANVVEVYNALGEEVEGAGEGEGEGEAAPEKAKKEKAPKEKKEKAPKVPKEKKEKVPKEKKVVEKDAFGSVLNTKSATMNAMLIQGATYEDIMAAVGATKANVLAHINFICKERGVVSEVKDNFVKCHKPAAAPTA